MSQEILRQELASCHAATVGDFESSLSALSQELDAGQERQTIMLQIARHLISPAISWRRLSELTGLSISGIRARVGSAENLKQLMDSPESPEPLLVNVDELSPELQRHIRMELGRAARQV